jgi:hypothetical protein
MKRECAGRATPYDLKAGGGANRVLLTGCDHILLANGRRSRGIGLKKGLQGAAMQIKKEERNEQGKVGWILLWLIGVPLPILLILFLLRGCT